MDEKTEAFVERAPKLRKRDVDAINDLFQSYIFLRRGAGEVITTCCRRRAKLPPWVPIWNEMHVAEPEYRYWTQNSERRKNQTPCPFCGRKGTVKEVRFTGQRKNLWEERRFALLRWDGRALWVETGWARKEYACVSWLDEAPCVNPGGLYRFGLDALQYAGRSWYGGYHPIQTLRYADFNSKTVEEPFGYSNEEGMDYAVLGLDALEKTPARWCQTEKYVRAHGTALKFLHLAYAYPRKVEMLMKAGMDDVIYDLAKRGVKHAKVIDWKAEDPRAAFRVPKEAVREFLALDTKNGPEIKVLETWQQLRRKGERVDMQTAAEISEITEHNAEVTKTASRYGLSMLRLQRWLQGQTAQDLRTAARIWADYVRCGEGIGLALHRSDVLLPRDLNAAHNEAVREYNRRQAQIRAEQEAAKLKAQEELYAPLRKKLRERYEYSAGGYTIRVPENGREIIDEGVALKHCVGGYAERHLLGKTTILFLRSDAKPDASLITIEMHGKELKQIHGYKNEGLYSLKGRFAPDPRETFRWLIDPWLDWIAKGSRRRKDGTPIVPKRKEKQTA